MYSRERVRQVLAMRKRRIGLKLQKKKLVCWIINLLQDILLRSIAKNLYSLFVFWLSLWPRQNTARLQTTPTVACTPSNTTNKMSSTIYYFIELLRYQDNGQKVKIPTIFCPKGVTCVLCLRNRPRENWKAMVTDLMRTNTFVYSRVYLILSAQCTIYALIQQCFALFRSWSC